jgi:signal transduction histidine kinase
MELKTQNQSPLGWMDAVWILFLAGLAVLSPVRSASKQIVLIALGAFQILESRVVARAPWGAHVSVAIKVLLATLLMMTTTRQEPAINSPYYPIYYLPVVTAAIYFGPWVALIWTAVAAGAYCSLLIPALREYELTSGGISELAIRILFLFLAGLLVNRFAIENRRQAQRYQKLAEELAETNRRLAQVEEEKRRSERLAALGQLSAGLAHEIRNPLGVIKGSAEMLEDKLRAASPLASELAGNISSEVNRLSALVARFLDFARPAHLELHQQEIVPLVERALKAVREQYPEAKVTVEREFAPELPRLLLDEGLCEQVFINLGLNAYEAMQQGGRLQVSVEPAEVEGRAGVEVRLQDSGPGIPAELREQIFNPFVTTKRTGAGLGLSIVSKIVDDHQGRMRVVSEPGEGAEFRVWLPVGEAQGPSTRTALA